MLTFDQFMRALTQFLEKEVLPNFSNIMQFVGYAMIAGLHKEAERMFRQYKNNALVTSLGIVDKETEAIDIDRLHDYAVSAIAKTKSVDLIGFSLDAKGIETLYNYLKQAETNQ